MTTTPNTDTIRTLAYHSQKTDLGRLHFVANETHLLILAFDQNWPKLKARLSRESEKAGHRLRFVKEQNKIIGRSLEQIDEYVRAKRRDFTVPCDPIGTQFEKRAWEELKKIRYGETTSYGEQAKRLKRPLAIRAVAAANGRNPLSILIPCHRVLGKSGALTGYAGGVEIKEELLQLEAGEP